MYNHKLKVYGEDLYNAGTSGVVFVGGTMAALKVIVVANADAVSFKASTVTIKHGDTKDAVSTELGEITIAVASNVKEGDVLGSYMLPDDVKDYVTASMDESGESTYARVTLEYLPR